MSREEHPLTRNCSHHTPVVQAFLILACYFMLDDVLLAGVCYFLSGFLDHFDGHAARKYNQCSQFGATLDMVTDRVATTLLVIAAFGFSARCSESRVVDVDPASRCRGTPA